MRATKLLWRVIRETDADRILMGLGVLVLVAAAALVAVEPGITSYGDAIWYCFSSITTIGFGDVVATTLVGRVITVVVGLSGILVIGLVTGVVVAFYNQYLELRSKQSLEAFADSLERLPELSPSELSELSLQFKRFRERFRG